MKLRLTLVGREIDMTPVDVEIDAPVAAPLETVLDRLIALLPDGLPRPSNMARVGVIQSSGRKVPASHPLGLPPLIQGAVLLFGRTTAEAGNIPTVPLSGSVLEIQVIGGPDCGLTCPVPAGDPLVIGRGTGADLRLGDPDLSRRHAEIRMVDGEIRVRDLASANGTRLDGARLTGEWHALLPGAALRIGGSTLVLRGPDRPAAAITPDGEGHLLVNRRTPMRQAQPVVNIEMPMPPSRPPPRRLPWLMVLLPLLLAAPAALILRQPGYLLFAVLSPVLMVGQHLADRRSGGQEARRADAAYRERKALAEAASAQALDAEAHYLEATFPDLARLAAAARIPTSDLWHRTPDHPAALQVRLGRGEVPSGVSVRDPGRADPLGTGATRVRHGDAPVVLGMPEFPALGICGPRRATLGLARSVIGQLAVLHPPADLRIELLRAGPPRTPGTAEDDEGWDWLTWLPHHIAHADPHPALAPVDQATGRTRLLVLDGAHALRQLPEVVAGLARAKAADAGARAGSGGAAGFSGTVFLCLEKDESLLPLECTAAVVLSAQASTAALHRAGQAVQTFRPDLAGTRWINRLARDLAPLRDATPDPAGALPQSVRLVDLLRQGEGTDPTDPAVLARAWRSLLSADPAQSPSPGVALGLSERGSFSIDLRKDGPHLLVGGTTGSGKSELLRTLIASLAIRFHPDRLTLLLVDYKGGAAFHGCTGLPHVGAVLTDLDHRSARRALSSFTAELRRRERLLLLAGVTDIEAYTGLLVRTPGLEALPRLVVVVDEFRVLAEELPDFVSGLVRVATVGRSLGVHLVLATQRPAGVVSPDIAANLNLRIALRVRDAADSRDLLADPSAALLPAHPGRALVRIGSDPPVLLQTAQVSSTGPEQDREQVPAVSTVRLLRPGEATAVPPSRRTTGRRPREPELPSDLERMVTAAQAAATLLGVSPARAPWLPELPGELELTALPSGSTGQSLSFGLCDLPDEQRQEVAAWNLTGNLAVAGGTRSGRSTLLRTLCSAAGSVPDAGSPIAVLLLDVAGRLADLESSGRADAVVRADDHERAGRLLRRIGREIHERRNRPEARQPVLLLVDDWDALTTAWSDLDLAGLLDQLLAILRDGPGAAIQVAVTGGVPLLTGRFSALFGQRLVLTLPDPADAMLAGVPAPLARAADRPGRGAWLPLGGTGYHLVQVALPGPDRLDGRGRADLHPGWAVPALPSRLSRHELSAAAPFDVGSAAGFVHVGIGGELALPVGLDLTAAAVTLVLGGRGTGRTTTVRTLAEGLRDKGISVLDLEKYATARPFSPDREGASERLTRELAEMPGAVVFLDLPPASGLGGSTGSTASDELAQVLAGHLSGELTGTAGHLVLTATAAEVAGAFRGVLMLAREAGQGIVLGAVGPHDGEVFGLRLERRPAGPPGRGLLIAAGRATDVQVAQPGTS